MGKAIDDVPIILAETMTISEAVRMTDSTAISKYHR